MFQPDQPRESFGENLQHAEKGRRQPGQRADRARQERGHLFRLSEANSLGHKFAEEEHERSQPKRDSDDCDPTRVRLQMGVLHQPVSELTRKIGARQHTCDHAAQREPELDQRQKPAGLFRQSQRMSCPHVPATSKLAELGFSGREDGSLRHSQQAVGQHQQAQD